MSEAQASPPPGKLTVDQLAEIQPGMAQIMNEVGERFTRTYYAAKGGNWKLAAYELNQVRVAFKNARISKPKYAEDLAAFDKEYLQPIFKAIHDKGWAEFVGNFKKGEVASDSYHDKRGYPHIRYVLPKDPPTNLYLGPPENFKRETDSAEAAP
jgi:hypothetical protein